MKIWFWSFICGIGTYFLFDAIGKLIDKSGITLESFVSCLFKIRDSLPIAVSILFIGFLICLTFKSIDKFME